MSATEKSAQADKVQERASSQERSLSTTTWLVMLCWPIVIATAAMYWSGKQHAKSLEDLAASRPEVVVVDDLALLELVIERGADPTDPRELFEGIKLVVEENGLDNTVLLSESMVMYTPDPARIVIRKEPSAPVREIR